MKKLMLLGIIATALFTSCKKDYPDDYPLKVNAIICKDFAFTKATDTAVATIKFHPDGRTHGKIKIVVTKLRDEKNTGSVEIYNQEMPASTEEISFPFLLDEIKDLKIEVSEDDDIQSIQFLEKQKGWEELEVFKYLISGPDRPNPKFHGL